METLTNFLQRAVDDSRIAPVHISLYVAIWHRLQSTNVTVLYFFQEELRVCSKLASPTTFYKTMRELHTFGYVRYTPAYNQYLGSLVELL